MMKLITVNQGRKHYQFECMTPEKAISFEKEFIQTIQPILPYVAINGVVFRKHSRLNMIICNKGRLEPHRIENEDGTQMILVKYIDSELSEEIFFRFDRFNWIVFEYIAQEIEKQIKVIEQFNKEQEHEQANDARRILLSARKTFRRFNFNESYKGIRRVFEERSGSH